MTVMWNTLQQSSLPALLAQAANRWPDRTYLDFSGAKFTFSEVKSEVGRVASGLQALGIQSGDRVCALLENSQDFVFLWFAVNQLNAVFVPVNTDMKGEFLRHQIEDSGAALVVVEEAFAERMLAIQSKLTNVKTLLIRGQATIQSDAFEIRAFASIRADEPLSEELISKPGDLAMLVYTSGTTGQSKGCMISHNYACHFAHQVATGLKLTSEDVHWSPCPLFHCAAAFGVVLSALHSGTTAAIVPHFSVSAYWDQIEQSGATVSFLMSVMFTLVPDAGRTEASERCRGRLKTVYGAPVNRSIIDKWQSLFGIKHVVPLGYGMTEACMLTVTTVDDPNIPDGASGRRNDAFDVRIFDEQGCECPPGVVGEVVVRPRKPDIMFSGYWRNPESTAAALKNLWLHTGDLGKFDENDYFYYVDRKKDCLRRGGENISSFEVEQAFLSHPDVSEIAAHAVQSELSEDDLKVTVVLRAGATVSEEQMWQWATENLPRFAVPRFIEFRESLPRTPSGRVKKYVLREDGVTPSTFQGQLARRAKVGTA